MSGSGGYGQQVNGMYGNMPSNWGGRGSFPGMSYGGQTNQGQVGQRQPGTSTGVVGPWQQGGSGRGQYGGGYGGGMGGGGYPSPFGGGGQWGGYGGNQYGLGGGGMYGQNAGFPYQQYGGMGGYNMLAQDMSRQSMGMGGYGQGGGGFQYQGAGPFNQWPGMGGYGMAGNNFAQGGGGGEQGGGGPMSYDDWQVDNPASGGFGGTVRNMFDYLGSQQGRGPMSDQYYQPGGGYGFSYSGQQPYSAYRPPSPFNQQTGYQQGGYAPPPGMGGGYGGGQYRSPFQGMAQTGHYTGPIDGKPQQPYMGGMAGGAPASW